MELEVVQVHELAAIAPRNIAGSIQFLGGSAVHYMAAVAGVHEQ